MSKIELSGVTKKFGKVTALKDVTLTFEENKIYGLLGRNGAGKSTMLNLISNRLFPTSGEIRIDGEISAENDNALSKIYCMSDKDLFPDTMKVIDVFKITKDFYPQFDMDYAKALGKKFELNETKKIKGLSTGYRSILKLVTALASNAPIVFFDEPVLGLDAHHRELFYRELITKYAETPATYVISTHLIEEASDIIENVVILKDGKLIKNCDTQELLSEGYTVSGAATAVDNFCSDKNVIGADTLGGLKTAYIMGQTPENIPESVEISKPDLQKLFIRLTENYGGENNE